MRIRKPTQLNIIIKHDADGNYSCNQDYAVISETVQNGGIVSGWVIDAATGAGRTGACVGSIQGAALQTTRNYVAIRYVATTFNPSSGAAAGALTVIYMKPDGTFTTSPS